MQSRPQSQLTETTSRAENSTLPPQDPIPPRSTPPFNSRAITMPLTQQNHHTRSSRPQRRVSPPHQPNRTNYQPPTLPGAALARTRTPLIRLSITELSPSQLDGKTKNGSYV
ncbi:hypothetical protein BP00DRAFT_273460 [Aspergillus indologenus CBS 114.80]|uniref:Uncharacterized protein n=1 Tax=Aspergillus indologenus CBS 114.80 TaxID=1450541 RepID=A0A2V5HWD9_9EURO|nr:hypothetical protein BP00DRAFT_273460 [Aspergillus indologenus CBS 114.80]